MTNLRQVIFGMLMLFSLSVHAIDAAEKLPESAFKEIMWDDLLPLEIGNGASFDSAPTLDYEESPADELDLQSRVLATVVPEMDGQAVRIPGFIVPLEFDDELTITEFFLVPYYGACTHSPPPPPNQIVFVSDQEGFKIDSIYTPFWISGVLNTALVTNDLGASAYTIDMQYLEEYIY
jgi:hypothetical protein